MTILFDILLESQRYNWQNFHRVCVETDKTSKTLGQFKETSIAKASLRKGHKVTYLQDITQNYSNQ